VVISLVLAVTKERHVHLPSVPKQVQGDLEYKVRDVLGDGLCYFRALLDSTVSELGVKAFNEKYRENVVNHLPLLGSTVPEPGIEAYAYGSFKTLKGVEENSKRNFLSALYTLEDTESRRTEKEIHVLESLPNRTEEEQNQLLFLKQEVKTPDRRREKTAWASEYLTAFMDHYDNDMPEEAKRIRKWLGIRTATMYYSDKQLRSHEPIPGLITVNLYNQPGHYQAILKQMKHQKKK